MKSLLLLMVFACSTATIFAQAGENNPSRQHYIDLYKRALKYNDTRTAITALNGYLTFGDDLSYMDTLGYIYYLAGDYYSSLLLTKEVTDARPDNLNAMERLASCYNQLGDLKSCVESYEKLTPKTKSPYHYYQLAVAQYQLKRIAECTQNLRTVIADTSSRRIPVSFTVSEGQVQNVPVMAAAYNMLGVIQMDAKNYADAKKLMTKAVEEFPNFVGAKQNIAAVDNITKGGGKPSPKPAKPPRN
ncbi:MAG: tetratricopeptide repeat protein [Dinghuibacter sp.]|nr:tetratricopeptide repeat protein [Dinghuibacter sp.]